MTTTRAKRPRSVPTLVRNLGVITDELAEWARAQLRMRALYEDPRRTPKLPDSTADDIMRWISRYSPRPPRSAPSCATWTGRRR